MEWKYSNISCAVLGEKEDHCPVESYDVWLSCIICLKVRRNVITLFSIAIWNSWYFKFDKNCRHTMYRESPVFKSSICVPAYTGPNYWWTMCKNSTRFWGSHPWTTNPPPAPRKRFPSSAHSAFSPSLPHIHSQDWVWSWRFLSDKF
jgi:hypothetical protein